VAARTARENGTAVANTATADMLSAGFSVGKITVMISNALIDGAVHASLDGKVLKSQSISVKALGENQVESVTKIVSVTIGVALEGSGASAEIGADAKTVASAAATSSLVSSGLIEFDASSNNHAKGESLGAGGGIIAASIDITAAIVQGETNASIGGSVEGSSAGVIVKAKSANDAQTYSETVKIGLLASAGGSESTSEVTGKATTVACGGLYSAGSCTGSGTWKVPAGAVSVTAKSENLVTAEATGGGGGGVSSLTTVTTADGGGSAGGGG